VRRCRCQLHCRQVWWVCLYVTWRCMAHHVTAIKFSCCCCCCCILSTLSSVKCVRRTRPCRRLCNRIVATVLVATADIAAEHGSFSRICQVVGRAGDYMYLRLIHDSLCQLESVPQPASQSVQPFLRAHRRKQLTDGHTGHATSRHS